MDKVIHSSPHLYPQVWTNDIIVLPQFPQGSASLWKTVRRGGSPLSELSTAFVHSRLPQARRRPGAAPVHSRVVASGGSPGDEDRAAGARAGRDGPSCAVATASEVRVTRRPG